MPISLIEVTSIWPGPSRYVPPTFTCGFCQIRTLQVISPRMNGSRSFFVNCTRGSPHMFGQLHVGIVRATAAFGGGPIDVLRRVFDIAGFAVDAVLRVDLEARALLLLHDFIDAGRAITL